MKKNRRNLIHRKLPNFITWCRILLVIVILVLGSIMVFRKFHDPDYDFSYSSNTLDTRIFISILVLFSIASITDYLDGYFARKYKVISKKGKVLDPIADKMLTIVTLIILSTLGIIFLWLTLLLIMRDVIINSIRIIHSDKNKIIEAKWHGKLKTVFLFLGIMFGGFLTPANIIKNITYGQLLNSSILLIALVISFFSLFSYIHSIYFIKKKPIHNLPKSNL